MIFRCITRALAVLELDQKKDPKTHRLVANGHRISPISSHLILTWVQKGIAMALSVKFFLVNKPVILFRLITG